MKIRIIALLLLTALLVTACGSKETAATTSEETTETVTEPEPAGFSELTDDTVLFYTQEGLKTRTGVLVPLSEVEAAGEDVLLPRTHRYDGEFTGSELFLQLTDYCFGMGYAGYSVHSATMSVDLNTTQARILTLIYHIDDGTVGIQHNDGDESAVCTTVWMNCSRSDTMEKFYAGLIRAREIAAGIPQGLDEYGTLEWISEYLKTNVSYGDLHSYYVTDGHQLYDALVKGVTVCTGYSDAMYYLCNLCGVDCIRVDGICDFVEPGEIPGHAWNIANLNGTDYCFDPTFNSVLRPEEVQGGFALSECSMSVFTGCNRRGFYSDNPLIPEPDHNYQPALDWNDTPAGTLRSYLWFLGFLHLDYTYLVLLSDLLDPSIRETAVFNDDYIVFPTSYDSFLEWVSLYMDPAWFESEFTPIPFRNEEGCLAAYATNPGGPVYQITSEPVLENGVYRAELIDEQGTPATAEFTVEENEGRFRISGITIIPG